MPKNAYQKLAREWKAKRPYVRARTSLPVKPQVALFQSFHGRNITCFPFYLLREFARRGTHQLYVAVEAGGALDDFLKTYELDAEVVTVGTPAYQRLLATAGVLVNNSTFPQYFIKRPEQTYLNTWHGTPLKTLGIAMPQGLVDLPNVQRNFLKADYLLYTNTFTRECMTRDYMIQGIYEGVTLLMGSPRNEILHDQERRQKLREELGFGDRKVILYMPTWRGGNARDVRFEEYQAQVQEHLRVIESQLNDECIFLVQFHSLLRGSVRVTATGKVRAVPPGIETYDLLTAVDVLVSDYSSVMFDFAVTKREIVLFVYDLEEYQKERGFYFPIEDVPFPLFRDASGLAEHLNQMAPFLASQEYDGFVERFAPLDLPGAAAKIVDRVVRPATKDPEGRPSPQKHLVLVSPPFTRRAQKELESVLKGPLNRQGVVVAFKFEKRKRDIERFIQKVSKKHQIHLQFVLMTGMPQFTLSQLFAFLARKLVGTHTPTLRAALRAEGQRLFGLTNFSEITVLTPGQRAADLAWALRCDSEA